MAVAIEKVMDDLINGVISLDAARQLLATEVRKDPQRTRFWPQRIETEMSRGRISASTGRALFDAIESFGAEQTLWLQPDALKLGPASHAAASASRALPTIEDMRAALFDAVDGKNAAAGARPHNAAPSRESPRVSQQQADDGPTVGDAVQGRYKLIEPLGLGGVGRVFRAVDLEHRGPTDRFVTIKIVAVNLRSQPHAYEALQREVVRSQSLAHANIAALHDIDRDGDRVFIVMEPMQGRWLSHLIRQVRGQGMSYDMAWPIISGIAHGLAHAHERGVVHRDLSPHCVFLGVDGTPKIVGFGLAHAVPVSNESLDVLDTQTLRAYSEAYTADPWSQQSSAHAADDLYPLGVMAYEMLTGAHPFQRCSLSQARQKNLSYAPIPALNRRARKIIERCLSFERERRPNDAAGFVRRMRTSPLERLLLRTA